MTIEKNCRQVDRILREEKGAAAIEMALVLPVFVMMLWMVIQMGLVFRAVAGMQHALGQGARMATIFPTPTEDDIVNEITGSVYGIGPGTFNIADPVNGNGFVDLSVTYTQGTDLLFLPGPDVSLTRNKRVYVAN